MSNLIVNDKKYNHPDSLEYMFDYIIQGFNLEDTGISFLNIHGCNVNLLSPLTAINSFRFIKRLYRKNDGNQLHHFELSLKTDKCEILDSETYRIWIMYYILPTIENYLNYHGFQFICAIHRNTETYHIHVILNSIKFTDGNRMSNERSFYNGLLYKLRNYCPQWQWNQEVIYVKRY